MELEEMLQAEEELWKAQVLPRLKPDRIETDLFLLISRHHMRHQYFTGETANAAGYAREAQSWTKALYKQIVVEGIKDYLDLLGELEGAMKKAANPEDEKIDLGGQTEETATYAEESGSEKDAEDEEKDGFKLF